MEMTYDGALIMPAHFAVVDEEEMEYLDGGRVVTKYGTAKSLKNLAACYMAWWGLLAAGYGAVSVGAAASSAITTVLGMGIASIAGLGTAAASAAVGKFAGAYNYFSTKSATRNSYMQIISFCGWITGVNCG